MEKSEYTTVPIIVGFNHNKPIGDLRILTSMLPSSPNFVFSLGVRCLEDRGFKPGEIPSKQYEGRYELMCVSPITDDGYIAYLQQAGKLPK